MSLSVGARLGHYDVTAKLGEGGMGEVWEATDTQLNRDVALKILPEAFADDPDRLARFQREAQVLASLNHPGIAAIYGIEEDEGTRALVLRRRWFWSSLKARRWLTGSSRGRFLSMRRYLSPRRSPKPSRRLMSKASSTAISNRPISRSATTAP